MVIAAMWTKSRERKIRRELNAEWDAWLRRRDDAAAKGIPFNEPRPDSKD